MKILEHVPLAPYTTLGVGGPARYFAEARNEAEVPEAVAFAREQGLPLFVLGGGSNLLVSDAGYSGLVLMIALSGITEASETDSVLLEAGAGEPWDEIVRYAVDRNYAGIECLAGIPGSVGGTPVQNVGAYGQEVAETIVRVRAFDLEAQEFVELDHAACGFAYRRSILNTSARGRYIVSSVTYSLRPGGAPTLRYADVQRHFATRPGTGETPTLREVYDTVRFIRESKGMLVGQGGPDGHSAGSFFKNPIVRDAAITHIATALALPAVDIPRWPTEDGMFKLPAAWLVERAGFHKGFALGRAGLSSRHTLALVNRGAATAAEILALRDAIVLEVHHRFGITLEQEPVQLP